MKLTSNFHMCVHTCTPPRIHTYINMKPETEHTQHRKGRDFWLQEGEMVPDPINTILFLLLHPIVHGFQSSFQKHIAFRDVLHGCFVGILTPSGFPHGDCHSCCESCQMGHSLQGIRSKVLQEGLRWLGASLSLHCRLSL